MAGMTIEQIKQILPHRYPFLMVDRVEEMDTEARTIVAIKNVSVNEPFFQGHFPQVPVMPGVLQLEAMAQTGGILLLTLLDKPGIIPYFMTLDKVRFRRTAGPGDQLRIEASIRVLRSRAARLDACILVDGEVVSEAKLGCAMAEG